MKIEPLSRWLKPAALWAVTSALAMSAWAAPKNVLVVTVTKGFRHDVIPATDQVLAELAKASGQFTLDWVRTDADMATKMTPEALARYDGVILNNTSGDLPIPQKEKFIAWVKSGKALIGLHAATDTWKDWPEWVAMMGGAFKIHYDQVEIDVFNEDAAHPAGQDWGKARKVLDEIYLFRDFHRDQVHGLLTQDKHPNTGLPGDYPIAWCHLFGAGKVFYTALGHRIDVVTPNTPADFKRLNSPELAQAYQQHLLGGIRWALGLAVGDATPQNPELKLSEAEIKAGFKPLFNGRNLAGWKLRNPNGLASWSAQNGMLVNEIPEKQHGTDLVTEEKYWNFTVRFEYMVPKGANSGFYLRGRHEIQIVDDFNSGKPSPGGNGAIYNLAAPAKFASRPAGQWQTMEATIIGNRVTAILNGVTIHDQLVVDRATGSEIDRNVNAPGPMFVQGDHGAVAFRNLRLKVLP